MRELSLLEHIYAANAQLPPRVTLPPGDDMGAVTIGSIGGGDARKPGETVLVTVDQIADGVHFDLATTPLWKVARKAITRNLSDVAAMGAVPVAAVAAGILPRGFGEARAHELFDHMREVAARYDCPLIGGDISMWDHPLLLSVTVLAEPRGIAPILRQGARVGDVICVTGTLGGSMEPIEIETESDHAKPMTSKSNRGAAASPSGAASAGIRREYVHHLDFEPRLALARRLAGDDAIRPHCMLDLSDGLGKDLAHLLRAATALSPAGLSAAIDLSKLPISRAAMQASRRDGRPAWQHALGDGEDYELCFTVSPEQASRLPRQIEGVPITVIGVVTSPGITASPDQSRITLIFPDGTRQPMPELGWEHHD